MVRSENNTLYFDGDIVGNFLPISAALYSLIRDRHEDIVLDFSKAERLDANIMIPLVTIARSYRSNSINFEIILPENVKSRNLIINSNWAHLILPEKFDETTYKSSLHLSALQYRDADQHFRAVDKSLDLILNSTRGLNRKKLKALEWALNEITDNVLNHAQSQIGGIFQVINYTRQKIITFYVCDSGVGIPRTLRKARPSITSDSDALSEAIKEGVTSSPTTNQGNGLFGTFQCCKVSGGHFALISGNATLHYNKNGTIASASKIPFPGTFVQAAIKYSYDDLLEKALVFRGKSYDPGFDYVEKVYQADGEDLSFSMRNQLTSFGSREAGKIANTKIRNLMDDFSSTIVFDFTEVNLISSSFADEVFGKLFLEMGEALYQARCRFQNIDPTVKQIIDRSVAQRARQM